jgi:hypothetical protein
MRTLDAIGGWADTGATPARSAASGSSSTAVSDATRAVALRPGARRGRAPSIAARSRASSCEGEAIVTASAASAGGPPCPRAIASSCAA